MRIAYLQRMARLVDTNGTPTDDALRTLNALIGGFVAFADQYALETSYPDDFTPPFIQADDLGNVTIAAHRRYYGDGTSVAVDGGSLATGELNPSVVFVYYDDTRRAGGAVTYEWSTTPPVQAGTRHVVGRVEIPAAGTQDGTYLYPPGHL